MARKVDESDIKKKELLPDVLSEADEVPEKERPSNKEDELETHTHKPFSRLATDEDVERAVANFNTLYDDFYK